VSASHPPRGLSRLRVRGVALTGRGWGMILIGVLALLAAPATQVRELLFIALVLLGLPIGAAVVLLVSPIRLYVQRSFDPRIVAVGDVVVVSVGLQNRGPAIGSELVAEDALARVEADGSAAHEMAQGRFHVPWLGASGATGSRIRARYHLSARRRGVHSLGPLRISRTEAFALASRVVLVGEAQPFVVTPRTVALESDVLDAYGVGGTSPVAHPTAGAGADDVIPRDYRAGDAMRRVHWRASARTGELKVRQDEQNTDPHAWVLLETRGDRFEGAETDAAFEWAVSMAASLSVHLIERGFEAHLVETAAADATDARASDEIEFAHDVLLHLARVQPLGPGFERDAPAQIAEEVRDAGGSRPVIAVLAHLSERDVDALGVLASAARPAIAFLIGEQRSADGQNSRSATSEALAARGWYTVVVDPDTSIDEAWSTALSMRMIA
jgi:uncharacterized protein (DUF58 family)